MLSTQTTETTQALNVTENPLTELMAPMCAGDVSPTASSTAAAATTAAAIAAAAATFTTPFFTTLAAPLGNSVNNCVNCTVISTQKGATIVSPLLLGLTGTMCQIWALVYLHCGTRRQNQRTVFYLLLCILIWTDFFGKILTTPPAIISYSYKTWVGGKPMCDFHGFSMVFVALLTHFTVSAMAVERFLGICHGYFYSRNITASRCKMLFFGIWMFCFAFGVLPLFHVGKFYLQYPGTWCFTNLHLCQETPILQKIFTTIFGIFNVTNLLIIVVCNVMVVGSLLRMRITPHKAFEQGQPHRNRKKNEQELQMVIVLIVITCVFVISWAPLDIILVINQFWEPHGPKDHFFELVAVRLCSINQIVDPIAYIICRVIFRSRFWRCCHRTIMGRGWSRRGDGGSHFPMSSLLQSRKFSRTQSPPKDQIATIKEEFAGEGAVQPSKQRTRTPSIHKSHCSDSGTGSYSGVDTPLVEKAEEQIFASEVLPKTAKGTALEQSLAKSLSVAIPIPLFKSEQYRVAECGKEEVDGRSRDVYYLVDGTHHPIRHRISNPEEGMKSLNVPSEHADDFPFISISGCEDAGVCRSNSWGCRSTKLPQPQYRTKSTQTLAYGIYDYPNIEDSGTKTSEAASETQDQQDQIDMYSQQMQVALELEGMLSGQDSTQSSVLLSVLDSSSAHSQDCTPSSLETTANECLLSKTVADEIHVSEEPQSESSKC